MLELRPYTNNQMNVWSPFSGLREFDRFFDRDFFGGRGTPDLRTDITDEGDFYQLTADLPGVKKEDIQMDIDSDVLTIRAERHSECEEKDKQGKFVRCERTYGAFSRSFDISAVNADEIKAAYESGVLTLKMPKKTEQTPASRRIELE